MKADALAPDAIAETSFESTFGRTLLAVAILSGCGLMAPMAAAGPLVLDEHGSYWIIESGVPSSVFERSLSYAAIPPLSSWLQAAFLAVAGKSELVFRLPSALCYLLAICFTYLLGRNLNGPVGGGLAALVLAWHPEALDEVRIARCYGLVLLLAALFLWITVRWQRQPERLQWAVAWGFIAAGLLWTHYTTAPLIGLSLLTLIIAFPIRDAALGPPLKLWGLAVLLLCGLAAPLAPVLARLWAWSPYLNFMPSDIPIWHIIGPLWWLGLPVGGLVAKLLSRYRDKHTTATVPTETLVTLAVWALVPLCCIVVFAQGDMSTLANPRYRVAYAVPGACLFAVCLSSRYTPVAACIGTVAALALTWWMAELPPWQLERLKSRRAVEWKTIAEIVEREGRAGEPVIVQSGLAEAELVAVFHDDRLLMDYVASRLGRFYLATPHPRYGLPFLWYDDSKVKEFYLELLAKLCENGSGIVWVAAATDTDRNRLSLETIQQLLQRQQYVPIFEQRFDDAVLLRYECRCPGAK